MLTLLVTLLLIKVSNCAYHRSVMSKLLALESNMCKLFSKKPFPCATFQILEVTLPNQKVPNQRHRNFGSGLYGFGMFGMFIWFWNVCENEYYSCEPLIQHLLRICSYCFGKVTSKIWNTKPCNVLIFDFFLGFRKLACAEVQFR